MARQSMLRTFDRVVDLVALVGGIAVGLMAIHIFADVFAKVVLGRSLPGTIVFVSSYYMVLVAFLPLAFTERRDGHVSVEVLVEHFPMLVQRRLNVLAMLLSAAIFAALAWQGWIEAERARQINASIVEMGIRIPVWPARYTLPVGAGLMALTLLVKTCLAVFGSRNPDK